MLKTRRRSRADGTAAGGELAAMVVRRFVCNMTLLATMQLERERGRPRLETMGTIRAVGGPPCLHVVGQYQMKAMRRD